MFGQPKPVFGSSPSTGFGFGSTQFGASATTSQQSSSLFGQSVSSAQQPSVFGGSVFGNASAGIIGTTVKFTPPVINDVVQKNGQKVQVNAKHMCISAMKEYAEKSMEELRAEDYLQNRKTGSAGGAKSIFGTTASTGFGFGSVQTTAPSLFGTTPAAQTTQSSLFGNTGAGSIFGSSQPLGGAFGQTTQGSIFGAKPLFGASSSNTTALNLSNTPQQQTGFGFGQNAQGSIFGGTSTFGSVPATTSFSLFGSQPTAPQTGGFAFGKPAGTNIFGATTITTPSLFGSAQPTVQASPFGAPATSQTSNIFGGIKPAGTSIFGATPATAAPAFGFGAKTTASGLFSTTPASNTGFGLGTATPSIGTNLFGAKKPSPFGTPVSSTTPAFGFGTATNAVAPVSNLFGGTTGFGFGATSQPASGGIFGSSNATTTGGLFNKPAANAFGFSQPATSTPSLFGTSLGASAGTGGNIFGSTGGLNTSTSLGFGGLTGNTISPFYATAAATPVAQAPIVEELTQHARAQQHVLDMIRSMPYGQSSLFRHLNIGTTSSSSSSTATATSTSTFSVALPKISGGSVMTVSAAANTLAELHKANTLSLGRSSGAIGKGFVTHGPFQHVPLSRKQLFTGFQEDDALVSAQSPMPGDRRRSNATNSSQNRSTGTPDSRFFVRRDTWKRLNIPSYVRNSIIERSSLAASDFEQQAEGTDEMESRASSTNSPRSPRVSKATGDVATTAISPSIPRVKFLDNAISTPLSSRAFDETADSRRSLSQQVQTPEHSSKSMVNGDDHSVGNKNLTISHDATQNEKPSSIETNREVEESNPTTTANKAGIRLSKPSYYMFPTLDELDDLIDESGRCVVQDLVVGRQSYGHILFPGLTDITGIDFDEVVHIRRREVVVYPDDTVKPPQGYGLNRKAEVTLDGIWPTDKTTREFIKSPQRIAGMKFDERLEKYTQKMDATFIEYRPDTGSWVFEVKHFSKYRLDDSDEENESETHPPSVCKKGAMDVDNVQMVNFEGSLSLKVSPAKDTEMEDLSLVERSDLNPDSSRTRHPSRAFKGVRDSLFLAGSHLVGNDRFGTRMTDDYDDDMDFLSRRSRLDQMEKAHVQFDNTIPLETNELSSGAKITSQLIEEVEEDDIPQDILKFETLQSVHNPTTCDTLPPPKLDKKILCSLPYDRIKELLGGKSIDFRSIYFDAGLSRGDFARISWSLFPRKGASPQLVLLTADPGSDPPASVVASSISIKIDSLEEMLLNSALETSAQTKVDIDSSSCLQFYPESGPRVLDSYLEYFDRNISIDPDLSPRMRALHRALLLCQALWACHDDILGLHLVFMPRQSRDCGLDKQVDPEAYPAKSASASTPLNDLSRRQAVSEWIRAELRPWLDGRLEELQVSHLLNVKNSPHTPWNLGDKVSKSAVYEGIFVCLCCGEPEMACRLALTCRMSHLASCLSMAGLSDPLCKRGLQKQLRVWNELKQVLPFMPQPILRTYALLAGEIKVPITGNRNKTMLNVLAGVPYLQALGIHLWYLVDHSTDLAMALKLFSNNWHTCNTFEVAPPRPPEDTDLGKSPSVQVEGCGDAPSQAMLSRSSSRDVCYHLLRLASRPWHCLERTLDPQSIRSSRSQRQNPDSAELLGSDSSWVSSWHLWRVLMSLGKGSLNPIATTRLHEELACHLEVGGLWEWAVFVLMHEVEPRVRAASVKRLLGRNVTLQCLAKTPEGQWRLDAESVSRFNQAESFVLQRFGVPVKWIHEAKACLARSLLTSNLAVIDANTRRLLASLEASHWLAAGHFEAAHVVYMKHLLPDIMLHSNAVSISSVLVDADLAAGGLASLASKLMTVLQPLKGIPEDNLPAAFETGAGVYMVYARILSLAYQLALCNKTEEEKSERVGYIGVSHTAPMGDISDILKDLLANTQELVDLLQRMPTPTIRDRVVKSEVAVTVIRLISVFLTNALPLKPSKSDADGFELNDEENWVLCQRVKLLTTIDLPSEAILSELEALMASSIAQHVF
ncbi:hypothetical protein Aperf_G00000065908 [Anoplocephala perfoliata]